MSLIKCKKCDNEYSSLAESCPKCGYTEAIGSEGVDSKYYKGNIFTHDRKGLIDYIPFKIAVGFCVILVGIFSLYSAVYFDFALDNQSDIDQASTEFYDTNSKLQETSENMSGIVSVSGNSINEEYFQNMGNSIYNIAGMMASTHELNMYHLADLKMVGHILTGIGIPIGVMVFIFGIALMNMGIKERRISKKQL